MSTVERTVPADGIEKTGITLAPGETGTIEGDGTGEALPEIDGQDAEKGKLFEVPRVAVTIDEADPGVLKLAFSGSIELDRANADDVAFYNSLKAGRDADLSVSVFCAGPKNSHHRDAEGNVDAVVQTKSLIVHSIDTA